MKPQDRAKVRTLVALAYSNGYAEGHRAGKTETQLAHQHHGLRRDGQQEALDEVEREFPPEREEAPR